ncbi:MAG: cytochrome c biogenesis protein CcsA [Actinomycetes bacterium]
MCEHHGIDAQVTQTRWSTVAETGVRRGSVVLAALWWLLVARLVWALLRTDLGFAVVAEHTLVGEAWWFRVTALWGGMEGSLLLFTAMLTTAAAIAVRQLRGAEAVGPVPIATVAVASAVGVVGLALAWPFTRLDVPAVQGFGLTPILRHWAMVVHPPLLYLGVVCTVPAFVSGRHAHRWLLATVALLTAAMALGGFWSYLEQGWGGYWAWDPVENTSLAVWLAAIVGVHGAVGDGRRARVMRRLPFVVALAGAAVARSGVVASVHSFAESAAIGAWLGAVALAALVVAVTDELLLARRSPRSPSRPLDAWRITPVLLVGASLAVVVVFTAAPIVASGNGEVARLEGRYFARVLGTFAAVAAVALGVLAVRARRRVRRGGWLAHAGMLVLLIGAAGSSFDRWEDRWIATGETLAVAGTTVTNHGVELADGSMPGSTAVIVRLTVAGESRGPALVTHPERGGVLAETVLVSRPWRDVQVALLTARDDGRALLEGRTKPLVPLVGLGAVSTTAGAALAWLDRSARVRRRHHRPAVAVPAPTTSPGDASVPAVR